MRPHIVTAIDIGSGFVKAVSLLGKPGEPNFRLIGPYKEVSAGVRKGVVIDASKVGEIILSLVEKIEQDAGNRIKKVYTNLGGSHLFCVSSQGLVSVSRADKRISEEDVERVLKAAQTLPISSNKEIVNVFPKEFKVDGEGKIKEVVGLEGVRLEAEVLLLCGFSPYISNSVQAVVNSGLQLSSLVPNSLASARVILDRREKELGVCLLDIGAGTTDMAVFEEGEVIHYAVFPIGSGHITNDIAICFKTDIDTAERIKLEFGSCKNKSSQKKATRKIKIETRENPIVFTKKALTEIIEARVCEVFDLVSKELKKINRQSKLPAGVVLTGGGANLPGIKELVKKELKLPCRIGKSFLISEKDKQEEDFISFEQKPELATLYGLAFYANDLEQETPSFFKKGIFSFVKRVLSYFIP